MSITNKLTDIKHLADLMLSDNIASDDNNVALAAGLSTITAALLDPSPMSEKEELQLTCEALIYLLKYQSSKNITITTVLNQALITMQELMPADVSNQAH